MMKKMIASSELIRKSKLSYILLPLARRKKALSWSKIHEN